MPPGRRTSQPDYSISIQRRNSDLCDSL